MASDWQSIPEPELVPYQALGRLPVDSLLVLAPHPDDEVFGCGGLLALAARQGIDARVVVLSDGAAGGDAVARELESRAAGAALGYALQVSALQFWRLPDRGIRPDVPLVDRLVQQLRAHRPGWLLAPSPFEVHPDHRAVCQAAIAAASTASVALGFYEVGQPLMPNCLIDITAVMADKHRAMACFPSQLASQPYDQQVAALNRFRAYTLGAAVTHAEALWFPAAADSADAAQVLAALERQLARRLGVVGQRF